MAVPALRIPMSVPMEQLRRDMDVAKTITREATQHVVMQFVKMNVNVASTLRGTTALVTGLRQTVGPLVAIAGAIGLIVGAWKLLNAITDLGKEKIEDYNKIAKDAAEAGLGVEFFQRSAVAAKEFGLEVDDVSRAVKKLNDDLKKGLDGESPFSRRLNELKGAGNFEGNPGVGAVNQANTAEERYRAVVQLITDAMQKGERLAALDLAERFLPPKMLDALRANSEALAEMQARADKLSETKIVDEDTVARAVDLKHRLDEAHEVLANKFKPIQDDLVKLGLQYHESWVDVVQRIAEAVGYVSNLYNEIKKIPGVFAGAANAGWIKDFVAWMDSMGLNSSPEAAGITMSPPPEAGMAAARARLANGLKLRAPVQEAMRQATEIQSAARGDTSAEPEKAAKEANAVADAFDRAVGSLNRHAAAMQADAAAVGLSRAQQEQLRAELQLLEAARRSGVEITDKQIASYTQLRATMSSAQALQASGIKLEEEQAAKMAAVTQRIYENAEALERRRVAFQGQNDVLRFTGNELVNILDRATQKGAKFGEIMADVLRNVTRQLLQAAITGEGAFAKMLGLSSSNGGVGGLFGLLGKAFGVGGGAGEVYGPPMPPGMNANGTDNWRGGLTWVGERGPELLNIPRGAQIIPNDVARAQGGGQAITYAPSYSLAPGVSAQEFAMLRAEMARDRSEFASRTIATIRDARRRSVGI